MFFVLGIFFLAGLVHCSQKPTKRGEEIIRFQEFVAQINHHADTLFGQYLTEKFVFTDTRGQILTGKERVIMGWQQLFRFFPDYKIAVESVSFENNAVLAFGYVSGTYMGLQSEADENHWKTPAAWKVSFNEKGEITEWKEYGDTRILHEIIRSNLPETDF